MRVAIFWEKTEMRWIFALVLALTLVGCTVPVPVSCDDRDRDGGIGGTGTCEKDAPEEVVAAFLPAPQ